MQNRSLYLETTEISKLNLIAAHLNTILQKQIGPISGQRAQTISKSPQFNTQERVSQHATKASNQLLVCTNQFLPNSTQLQIIMSISQHHIGQPYYDHESINFWLLPQFHLYSLVFSFWFLPPFPHSKEFQPPHWIKSHSNS